VSSGILCTVDGRPALRFERRLAHPAERVWRALTEPAELAQWFVAPVPAWPAAGEPFEAAGQPGRMVEVDAPRVLSWTWGEERYRFELRPEGGGCVLTFTHVFDERLGPAAQHAAGWDSYLDRLEALLGGGRLSEEDAHGPVAERHERYAQRFGQDPGPGRRAIAGMAFRDLTLEDGPVLRLERRLPHPVERVWRALTDPGELDAWFPADAPMVVTEAVAPRLLGATWFGDTLRFELRPDGDVCLLVFTHAFADRDTSARTAAGWDRSFARLEALLADAPMDERASLELWPLVHERYAERFGVDPEIGRRAFAEHPRT
jgi:uncharacterized protein YndB with AHSA1/START domain